MAGSNGANRLPEPDDWLEWVPPEVQEAMREPRFRRLTPDERMRRRGAEVPAAFLRPKRPTPRSKRTPPTAAPTVVIAASEAEPAPAREEPERTPSPPPGGEPRIDAGLARRLAEVEEVVARASRSVDRRAEQVRTMLAEAFGITGGNDPG